MVTIDGAYGDSSVVLKVVGNFSFEKKKYLNSIRVHFLRQTIDFLSAFEQHGRKLYSLQGVSTYGKMFECLYYT